MDGAALSGLIVSVILERPVCLACVAVKVGETQLQTLRTIEEIGSTLVLTGTADDACGACGGRVGPVYSLARESWLRAGEGLKSAWRGVDCSRGHGSVAPCRLGSRPFSETPSRMPTATPAYRRRSGSIAYR